MPTAEQNYCAHAIEAEFIACRRRDALERAHDLRVRRWSFVACIFAMITTACAGLALLHFGGTPEREWTGTILLTAIVSGAVGYLARRPSK